jgi:hypothetical protein
MRKIGRKWAETYDLGLDLNEVIPEQPVGPGEVPSMPVPGQEAFGVAAPSNGGLPALPSQVAAGPEPAFPITAPQGERVAA